MKDLSRQPADWKDDIGSISSGHTQVAGMLAGFSATIVVLIIGLRFGNNVPLEGNSPAQVSLGIFAMAFFGYVATGILYSITIERSGEHRWFLFSTASIIYYFSGILSFAAVYPLVLLIQSVPLKIGVSIMVGGGLFGGYLAAAIPLYDLLLIKLKYIFATLVISVFVGCLLYYVLTSMSGEPGSNRPLGLLATACALVVVIGFNLVAFTFFLKRLNSDGMYRWCALLFIAFATITLCFAILVGHAAQPSTLPTTLGFQMTARPRHQTIIRNKRDYMNRLRQRVRDLPCLPRPR